MTALARERNSIFKPTQYSLYDFRRQEIILNDIKSLV